jgi:hypothetical protein
MGGGMIDRKGLLKIGDKIMEVKGVCVYKNEEIKINI